MNGVEASARSFDSQSLENTGSRASRSSRKREHSDANPRMPLTAVAPNRNDQNIGSRAPYNRVEELGQTHPGISRSGSEADSLLDLYGGNGSDSKIRSTSYDNEVPENMYRPEDPDGWIHRDKLAKIESEELQAAGINLSSARRGRSKSGRRDTSRSRKSDESPQSGVGDKREDKKPRLSEPVTEEPDDDRANWDLRSPEEIAQDNAAAQMYSQPTLKKSGSRIPVLTSSPHPIPPERLDRDTPLPRRRTMSNSMNPEDSIVVNKARSRDGNDVFGNTDAAAPILNTPTPKAATHRDGSKPASPTKKEKNSMATPPTASAASLRKVTPSSLRKPSGANKAAAGPLSPTGSISRDRSVEADRPRTAVNRPEGDPPWLATMYKPDPRLPPDQQIIPTHARKQQQAQWADDGSVPKTYDRDFTPLAVHPPEELAKRLSDTSASPNADNAEKQHDGQQSWPLKTMNSVRSTHSNRPGTSGSITGNYSTMPKVQPSPIIQQSPRVGGLASPRLPAAPSRLQEQRSAAGKDDDGTVKKGCGCCIVM